MANIVLTSSQGISGVPGTSNANILVPGIGSAPNNVVVIDSSEFTAVKWIYNLIDVVSNRSLVTEVTATQNPGSPIDPQFNRYGIVGDLIAHTIDVKTSGSNMVLEITNLQANQLIANVIQIYIAQP